MTINGQFFFFEKSTSHQQTMSTWVEVTRVISVSYCEFHDETIFQYDLYQMLIVSSKKYPDFYGQTELHKFNPRQSLYTYRRIPILYAMRVIVNVPQFN